ncbi:unnamed protein product, partial [Schistosoma mattheei]
SIREKLRSYQPKLLELSDRADRICRASSTAALTMNQIFMTHSSQLDINDSVNTPVFTGYDHQHQLATNQNEINNLQAETIGSKAKRQLNEFRNEFNEINQQITEVSEILNEYLIDWIMKISTSQGKHEIQWTARMQLSDLDFADDLALLSHTQQQMQKRTTSIAAASAAVGLNIHEEKSKILRYNKTSTSPITLQGVALKHLKSFTYLANIIDEHGESDADVNAWIGRSFGSSIAHATTNAGEDDQCNSNLNSSSIIGEHGGSDADVNEWIGEAREAVLQLNNIWISKQLSTNTNQFITWINTIQQNYSAFRDSAQTVERWMNSINFRLMSAGTNNTNSNLTGNLSAYQDSTIQIDQFMKEINKEGKNLLENTHQLIHLLIHNITKDQATISRTNRICESITCPYREIPIDHSVVDNWKYLVNSSNDEKLLDRIILDVLERNKEIEINYMNIHSNAQSIKSRLDDQLNRFKAYIDSLNSVATFILNDLQSWWKRLSVISQSSVAVATITGITTTNQLITTSDPISSNSYNVTGLTTYPNKSFINYQIDRLKQLTDDKPLAKAVSLEDVGHQLAMTLAMQSQLMTMKRELSTLGYKCGMSSVEIDYISQEGDKSSDNKGNSSDQTLVKLLAKHVQNGVDIENKKLECHTEQLRELRTKWEHYVKERDIFGRWLSERQTACHHLLELRSRSAQPEDEESRALEVRNFFNGNFMCYQLEK